MKRRINMQCSVIWFVALVLGACDSTATAPVPCPPSARIDLEPAVSGTIILWPGQAFRVRGVATCLSAFRGTTWSTSNSDVVAVEISSDNSAEVRAIAPGAATITATATADPGLTSSFQVRVSSPKGPPPPVGNRSGAHGSTGSLDNSYSGQ